MKIFLEPVLVSIIAGLFILVIPNRFRKVTEFFSLLTSLYLFTAGIRIFFASPVNAGLLNIVVLDSLVTFPSPTCKAVTK